MAGLRSFLPGGRIPIDQRSRRVVALIECHINQNARVQGAAKYPAQNDALLDLLRGAQVGLLQIPCPEVHALGWARERPAGVPLRKAMEMPRCHAECRELARDVADRIEEYLDHGIEVVAVLGGDVASPGCAVHADGDGLSPRSGIFTLALDAELQARGRRIPFRGIRESDPDAIQRDLRWLEDRLA